MLLAPKLRASVMRLDSDNALRLTYLIFKCFYVPVSCHSYHVEFGSHINPISKEKHLPHNGPHRDSEDVLLRWHLLHSGAFHMVQPGR
jgi:hypothetical protein